MRSFKTKLLLISSSILSAHCTYGPKKEAKVASAIQTLMAILLEGSFSSLGGTGGAPVACGVSGTFTAGSASFGTIDPLDPSSTAISTPINFDHCTIKVCGETFAINGSGTSIDINFGDLGGLTGATSNTANIAVTVTSQEFEATGFLSGSLSFAYDMNATVGNSTLESITIDDADPAVPLIYEGKTYNGSALDDLADGC